MLTVTLHDPVLPAVCEVVGVVVLVDCLLQGGEEMLKALEDGKVRVFGVPCGGTDVRDDVSLALYPDGPRGGGAAYLPYLLKPEVLDGDSLSLPSCT